MENHQGPVSRKSRKLFGPEEPFVRLRFAYSVKLIFSYVVKGIKIKLTAKFRASRRLRFEDTKRIMSPEMRPKSFGTFEKQAPGQKFLLDAPRLSLCYWLSRSIKLPHREVSLCTTLSFAQAHFRASFSASRGRHMSGSGRWVASVYPSPLYAGGLHLNCVMIALFACLRVL